MMHENSYNVILMEGFIQAPLSILIHMSGLCMRTFKGSGPLKVYRNNKQLEKERQHQ